MKLDPTYLHFMTKQQLRILSAIQMGMRNHQYVSYQLIARIGNLRNGETYKIVRKLLKNKFVTHTGKKCDGYKLTYLGYDYLALQTFMKRGLIQDVVMKIGVGKQSDVYKCINPQGEFIVLKLTRLGRRSFKTIKNNRQYIQNRTSYNWLYLSRLSSIRQFTFMQLLHQNNFPTPKPIDCNRHAILMSLVEGYPLCQVKQIGQQIGKTFETAVKNMTKLASYGLIHSDYNQFNIMINDNYGLTMIDFPQCISIKHPNAKFYFERDLECLYKFFDNLSIKSEDEEVKKFDVSTYPMPNLDQIQIVKRLDQQIKAIGHITLTQQTQLEQYRRENEGIQQQNEHNDIDEEDQLDIEDQLIESDEEQKKQKFKQFQIETGNIELKQQEQNNQEIKDLIQQLDQQFEELEDNEQDLDEEQKQQYKGLTGYQIRIKIKQQKRIQREKRKAERDTTSYIKNALKKHKVRNHIGKGNFGTKTEKKKNLNTIKEGLMDY